MSKPEFVYVIYIQSTAEKIWNALRDPEMTKEFWAAVATGRTGRSDRNGIMRTMMMRPTSPSPEP
jgi:uncharacterized protein YndB with AHSA1/START domain